MNEPTISIDRASKRYAVFDGFKCVLGFADYLTEEHAIAAAKEWIKERTDIEPEIVYPRITRMTMTTSSRRRK